MQNHGDVIILQVCENKQEESSSALRRFKTGDQYEYSIEEKNELIKVILKLNNTSLKKISIRLLHCCCCSGVVLRL